MPALNIAANRLHATPVTHYYKGKAMRLAQENQRIANETAQSALDYEPERQRLAGETAARQERQVVAQEQNADTQGGRLQLQQAEAFNKAVEPILRSKISGDELVAAIDKVGVDLGLNPNPGSTTLEAVERMRAALPEIAPKTTTVSPGSGVIREGEDKPFYTQPAKPSSAAVPTSIKELNEADRIAALGDLATTGQKSWADKIHGIGDRTGDDQKERLVKYLTPRVGLERARDIAYGVEEIEINENTGTINVFNPVTRTAYEIPIESLTKSEAMPAPDPQHTLWQFAVHGTGLGSTLAAVGNVPIAWAGLSADHVTNRARQALRTAGLNMVRALSNNPKFPEGERKAIAEEINIVPALFDDPLLLHGRLQEIHRALSLRAAQYEYSGSQPSMPEDKREMWRGAAGEIRMFLPIMGVRPGLEPGSYFVGKNDQGADVYMFSDGTQRVWSDE